METGILLVFGIIFVSIILFVTEYFTVDKIAFFIIVSLALLNVVTPEEAISGFSNSATITVLCLMIIAIGLEENGVIRWLTDQLKNLQTFPLFLIAPVFMIMTAGISSFISTTAVVIIFIKIIFQLTERFNIPAGKLLMPVSFAGILGGSCTLMGTSTNLIVNSLAQELGAEKLGFFEFAVFGAVFLVIGIVYMTIVSRFLPKGKAQGIDSEYNLDSFIATVEISQDSKIADKPIEDTFLYDSSQFSILKLLRQDQVINSPGKYISLRAGDQLVVMCALDDLIRLSGKENFSIASKEKVENSNKNKKSNNKNAIAKASSYVELLLLPGSSLLGKTLRQLTNLSLNGAIPVAIQKRRNIRNTEERLIRKDFKDINLKPGDRLLVETSNIADSRLDEIENVVVLEKHEPAKNATKSRRFLAFAIFLCVIALAATGTLSILTSSLTGVALLLLTNCLTLSDTYKKVDWQIIFLLAGMIPLGVAMTNSGADVWLSKNMLGLLLGQSNVIVLGVIFLVTMLLSGAISNNATAIIMLPIAISVANGLNLPLKPFILAIMFAANFSFFTPVGYQTNTLIYGLGIYNFKHFLIIGGILSLILWIVATLMLSTLL